MSKGNSELAGFELRIIWCKLREISLEIFLLNLVSRSCLFFAPMNSSMIRSTSKFCKNQKCYRDFQFRSSLLEIRNISNNHSLLTGFFVIFWISSFCYFLNSLYQNHQRIGLLVGGTVGRMLVKNLSRLLKVLVGIFI